MQGWSKITLNIWTKQNLAFCAMHLYHGVSWLARETPLNLA